MISQLTVCFKPCRGGKRHDDHRPLSTLETIHSIYTQWGIKWECLPTNRLIFTEKVPAQVCNLSSVGCNNAYFMFSDSSRKQSGYYFVNCLRFGIARFCSFVISADIQENHRSEW